MEIEIKVLDSAFYEGNPIPSHATKSSAGIDLRAAIDKRILILPGESHLIPTGLAFAVPEAVVMLLTPRSGLGHKHGIVLGNLVGVIDPDYRGEVKVSLWNRSEDSYWVAPGDRICQALFLPFHPVTLTPVEELSETNRGEGGFNSTGFK